MEGKFGTTAVNLVDPGAIPLELVNALKAANAAGVETNVRIAYGSPGQQAIISVTAETGTTNMAGIARVINAGEKIEEALGEDTIVRSTPD